ncbi:MAG: hypothetical protein JWN28_13 [Candidatus Saccharibacteria bacterium]|nr:hypothetical protein [Candidatus Saccharibacteria bacterium]
MSTEIYIGTSGWHYNHWMKLFYPADIKGYRELTYHATYFNTVENNSSFYRIASEGTYKTWSRMTPESYKFSMKLNKIITHTHKLEINDEVIEKVEYILQATQILENKLGAILIQLPASFKYDLKRLKTFLAFFTKEVRSKSYVFDIAIEFRNKHWFTDELYALLKEYNVALVAGQSSRWPEMRQITADIAYIRLHGPEKLFASSYSTEQLTEWVEYIHKLPKKIKRVYVYFNNDFEGYALENGKKLRKLLNI